MFDDSESFVQEFAEFAEYELTDIAHVYSGYRGGAGALLLRLNSDQSRVLLKPWVRTRPVGATDLRRSADRYGEFKGQDVAVQLHVAATFRPNALSLPADSSGVALLEVDTGDRGVELTGAPNLPDEFLLGLVAFAREQGAILRHDARDVVMSGGAVSNPTRSPAPVARTGLFIAYRREDSQFATGWVHDRLVRYYEDREVFKDVDSFPLGVDFHQHAAGLIARSKAALVVIGHHFLTPRLHEESDPLRVEIQAILESGIPLIPLLVDGAPMPDEQKLPVGISALARRNGTPLRPAPDFHKDVDRLIVRLDQLFEQP